MVDLQVILGLAPATPRRTPSPSGAAGKRFVIAIDEIVKLTMKL
jgi:hypothetical protein